MASVDYFLTIEGISGESSDTRYLGAIELESFSFGATQSHHQSFAGGGGVGKAAIHDLLIVMKFEKSGPSLFEACAAGVRFPRAVLVARKSEGTQPEYLRITLSDVVISSFNTRGSANTDPMVEIGLNFRKIEIAYKEQKSDGSLGGVRKSSWDVFKNRAENEIASTKETIEPPIKIARSEGIDLAASLQFSTFFPHAIRQDEWKALITYVYVPEAFGEVQADSQKQLGIEQQTNYGHSSFHSPSAIVRGTEIVVVPRLPGCRFNPPKGSITWLEDWHRIDFRVQANAETPGFELGTATVVGEVAFYVGPLLVGEVRLWTHFLDETELPSELQPNWWRTAQAYQRVFVSYSHKDKEVVDKLDKAYSALGMQYLRDVRILRSGERWNEALLKKIEEANIFQLCWSSASKNSQYVEQEWRHALQLERDSFIRPVYWENPMPQLPRELREIHFAYLDW